MSLRKFGKYVSMLAKYTHGYIYRELHDYDLGSGQFSHLMSLYHEDGITQDTLASRLGIDKASTAKALKKMQQNGYITREPLPTDKRSNVIKLTDKSRNLKSEIQKVSDQWQVIVTEGISQEEYDIFLDVAIKMSENAKNFYISNYKSDGSSDNKFVCKGE